MKDEYIVLVLFAMLFGHTIADYCLQGVLARLKQREEWKTMFFGRPQMLDAPLPNNEEELQQHKIKAEAEEKAREVAFQQIPEQYDYIVALIMHAFMWAVVVDVAPLVWLIVAGNKKWWIILLSIILDTIFHAWIDDIKANHHDITLIQDQVMHVIQIVVTFAACCCAYFIV